MTTIAHPSTGSATVTRPPASGEKPKRPRKAKEGHPIAFRITDDALYAKLSEKAREDEREPSNMAALLVRRALRDD